MLLWTLLSKCACGLNVPPLGMCTSEVLHGLEEGWFLVFSWDRVSFCRPVCSWNQRDPPASFSPLLGLQECVPPLAGLIYNFWDHHTGFRRGCTNWHTHQQWRSVSLPPHHLHGIVLLRILYSGLYLILKFDWLGVCCLVSSTLLHILAISLLSVVGLVNIFFHSLGSCFVLLTMFFAF